MPKKKQRSAPEPLSTIGTRIRTARERAKASQKALAERAEIDAGQLSRYERNVGVEGIELATVIRIAEALGAPVGYLAADEGDLGPIPIFVEGADKRRRKTKTAEPSVDIRSGTDDDSD